MPATCTGQVEGRRFSIYISGDLVPQLRRAIANVRKLKTLLGETGRRSALALKHERGWDRTRR
ncbi:MAG: hypothetical protein PF483_01150 [Halothiobacillus sp.]|jgi:hypothetical protein|nr:hypothetical protein [Halothiobacillus sp.]